VPDACARLAAAFPHLPKSLLADAAQGLEVAWFGPGETIVREGDQADRFYIIESGQVEGTPSSHDADSHALTMQAGDYFGEVGLLAARTRTVTVRAISEVRVVSLDRARFHALVDASRSRVRGRRASRRAAPGSPGRAW
jgi:CRP-like cAMP-binding protein